MKYKHSKEELEIAIKNSLSIAQVCRYLNITPKGGNYKTLKDKIKYFDLDITHFTGAGWNTGKRYKYFGKNKRELYDILVENSPHKSSSSLKKRLIQEGLKEKKCEKCNNISWNNKDIPLELNHINGNNTDNRIENLEIICPNCHAQTDNYRGKNKKDNKRYFDYSIFKVHSEQSLPTLQIKEVKKMNLCVNCKKEVKKNINIYCSYKCCVEYKTKNNPKKDEIINAFSLYKNFTKVGKYFNVSDNAIRKWCKKYNINIKELNLLYGNPQ